MINVGPEQDIISIVPNSSNNNKRGNRKLLVRQEATTEQDIETDTNKDDITTEQTVVTIQTPLTKQQIKQYMYIFQLEIDRDATKIDIIETLDDDIPATANDNGREKSPNRIIYRETIDISPSVGSGIF